MKKLVLILGLILIASGCLKQSIDTNATVNDEEVKLYLTEEECELTNDCDCVYTMCDLIPENQTFEETCGVDFTKGWQCIAPVEDIIEIENNENEGVDEMEVVENGDKVKVEYIGKHPDSGEVFDKSEGRGPLEFVAGAGQMIKGFDKAVMGMKVNDEKTVTIPPEDAYGEATVKVEVPIEQISGEGITPEVGTKVGSSTGQQGEIVELKDSVAVIEFQNTHSLAGKTLEFWIKVIEIVKK